MGGKGKNKLLRVAEENPSGKKRLLNTAAYFFSLFGLQVVLKKKKLYLSGIQLFLYNPNLTEQLSANKRQNDACKRHYACVSVHCIFFHNKESCFYRRDLTRLSTLD